MRSEYKSISSGSLVRNYSSNLNRCTVCMVVPLQTIYHCVCKAVAICYFQWRRATNTHTPVQARKKDMQTNKQTVQFCNSITLVDVQSKNNYVLSGIACILINKVALNVSILLRIVSNLMAHIVSKRPLSIDTMIANGTL